MIFLSNLFFTGTGPAGFIEFPLSFFRISSVVFRISRVPMFPCMVLCFSRTTKLILRVAITGKKIKFCKIWLVIHQKKVISREIQCCKKKGKISKNKRVIALWNFRFLRLFCQMDNQTLKNLYIDYIWLVIHQNEGNCKRNSMVQKQKGYLNK